MIRQVKSLRVRDFSQTIFDSIHDNSHYMEEDTSSIYRHGHIILKSYSYDISIGSISTIRSIITVESSMSFEAFSSV
jgi:hypothetical protein